MSKTTRHKRDAHLIDPAFDRRPQLAVLPAQGIQVHAQPVHRLKRLRTLTVSAVPAPALTVTFTSQT